MRKGLCVAKSIRQRVRGAHTLARRIIVQWVARTAALNFVYGPGTHISWIVRVQVSDGSEPSFLHVPSMLEIEKVIAARLQEHANDVVRVVHTLTTRKIY